MEDRYFLAAVSCTEGIGPMRLKKLIGVFGSAKALWKSPISDIIRESDLSVDLSMTFDKFRHTHPDAPEEIAEKCRLGNISLLTVYDEDYPRALKEIYRPPVILYMKGTIVPDEFCLAMVGSRRATRYGETVAEELSKKLSAAGVTVVSGAAMGIDTAAHKGALKSGRTVAVLGSGVDICYPAENRKLLAAIAEKGAVVSEYPIGTPPNARNFPARNRIISGLSRGTVVVEAAEKSGALITAEYALNDNRDVFAVPGNIFSSMSRGCHRLIQSGAKLVADADDILSEYKNFMDRAAKKTAGQAAKPATATFPKEKILPDMDEGERAVYTALSVENPMSIDDVTLKLNLDVSEVSALLLTMSLKGLVKETDAARHEYVRVEGE